MEENNLSEILEINSINLKAFHHDEHFQLMTELKDLINTVTASRLKIDDEYTEFLVVYEQEDVSMRKILKSPVTSQRQQADKKRDATYSGLSGTVESAMFHFDPLKVAAAGRLNIVFKTYGNVARKSYNEATAAIHNILVDLRGKYATDIEILGLKEWVDELEIENNAFEELMKVRFTELEEKTDLKAKEVREKMDKIYALIVKRINAIFLIEKDLVYKTFIRQWNTRLKVYNDILAQRKGRAEAKKKENEEEEEEL
ncbi:MAG: DUF6261 family protein [Bacteroidales bacterium]|jgi:hypothetical protein|nr:DUF6261 family protein [Bacteroidales bacterium]